MGKIKSAILITLITLIVAVLCVVCFVPFPLGGDGIHYFNPIVNWAEKSADFGGYQFGEGANYLGGSYTVVFYPEGVISAQEHSDNEAAAAEEKTEYVSYANGTIWLDKEKVCGGGSEPTDAFKNAFGVQVDAMRARVEGLHVEGARLEVRDDYTIFASLPASLDASVAAFLYFSYMGDVTILYGTSSDAASASQVIPEAGKRAKPIGEYLDGVYMRNNAGTIYVEVDFTETGLGLMSGATSGAADSAGYLFIQVGGNTVINLSVSEQVHDNLYISGSYTAETANIVASTVSTAIAASQQYEAGSDEAELIGLNMGELYREQAGFTGLVLGSVKLSALNLVYIALGVLFLISSVFFLIRYGLLGFAHILTYLAFATLMTLIYWAVPVTIGAGTIAVFGIASALLTVCNAVAFEYAKKEYAVGKTISSSVKTGYKKCFWHIFDLHVALLIVALLVYLIALNELAMFGLALTFGVALSGLCTLVMNRFLWYLMVNVSKDSGKLCHFKREEVEDDE